MPRNPTVYGKRRPANHTLTTQCFADNSSPVKPIPIPYDSPSNNTRLRFRETVKLSDDEIAFEALSLGVRRLGLGDQSQDATRMNDETSNDKSKLSMKMALQPRSANVVTGSISRSCPSIVKQEVKSKETPAIGAKLVSALSRQPVSHKATLLTASPRPVFIALDKSGTTHKNSPTDHCSVSATPSSGSPLVRKPPQRRAAKHPDSSQNTHTDMLLRLAQSPTARKGPLPFQEWADSVDQFLNISKMAEASYGEVYRLSLKCPQPGFSKSDESVIKVIALKPPAPCKGARSKIPAKKSAIMSDVHDVASEVRLLQRMSPVPGFATFRDVKVMQGTLPSQLVTAWKYHNKNVKKSEFPDPSRKNSYAGDQLWAVVEMQDAGSDLEDRQVESIWDAWDIFWNVTLALAKGEEFAQFEHRDLHLGNICVKRPPLSISSMIDLDKNIGFTGLEATLIDYTLSRADLGNQVGSSHSYHSDDVSETSNSRVAYFDLAKDPAIFEGNGEDDYQYDMYRHMRSAALHRDPSLDPYNQKETVKPKKHCSRKIDTVVSETLWRDHHPLTNLVWLHFVLYKLTEHVLWPSAKIQSSKTTLPAAHHAKARKLEDCLLLLINALDLEGLKGTGLGSAKDLVTWSVEQGWLNEQDVIGRSNEEVETEKDEGDLLELGPSKQTSTGLTDSASSVGLVIEVAVPVRTRKTESNTSRGARQE